MYLGKTRVTGQALVEFAMILVVLLMFIFIIIESGRVFQGWVTVQNAARAAGRYALTGQFNTDCLYEFPACLDPRVDSIKEEALQSAAGLVIDPSAVVGQPKSFVTEVWGQDEGGAWKPDYAGRAGKPVRVRVTYHLPIITPLLRPIMAAIGLAGQVVVTSENYDQISSVQTSNAPPDVGDVGGSIAPPEPEADLKIEKSVDGPLLVPGDPPWTYTADPLVYTLEIENLGPFDAEDVVVIDTLPVGTTSIAGTVTRGGFPVAGAGCLLGGGNVLTCQLPNLAGDGGLQSRASVTISVTAPISSGLTTNSAMVTNGPSTADPDPSNNNATASVDLVPWAVLTVDKFDVIDPVRPNELFAYSISVTNDELNVAHGVKVVDNLPDNVVFNSVSGPAGVSCGPVVGSVLTCDLPDLSPDGLPFTFDVHVFAPDTLTDITIENQVTVSADEDNRGLGDTTDSETTQIVPLADLTVEKHAPHERDLGDSLLYLIWVFNQGPDPASGITVVDSLPGSVDFVAASDGCSYDGASHSVTCSLGTMYPSPSEAVSRAILVEPRQAIPVVNQVSVSATQTDPDPSDNVDTATTTIKAADLELTKSAPEKVTIDEPFTYALEIVNRGPSRATGVKVVDMLPSTLEYVSDTADCLHDAATNKLTCYAGYIPPLGRVTVQIRVVPTELGEVVNTASVSADQTDTDLDNNSDGTNTLVLPPMADLKIVKSAPGAIFVGELLQYTLEISNLGDYDVAGVVVTDTLPADVNFVSALSSRGACRATNGRVVCDVGSLAVGATATVTIEAAHSGLTTEDLTNTATVTGDKIDPDESNNTDVVVTEVLPLADLALSKNAPSSAERDTPITYTLTITNNGPSPATGVSVVDSLPTNLAFTYVSATPSQGSCAGPGAGLTVACELGGLADGAAASVTIMIVPTEVGSVDNAAAVSGNETDPNLADNTAVASTAVKLPAADLELAMTAIPQPVRKNRVLTFELDVTNSGPSKATGVTLTHDLLAGDFDFVWASSGCDFDDSRTITCDLPDMLAGTTSTSVIQVMYKSNGDYDSEATVYGLETDPYPANNTVYVQVEVTN